MSEKSNKKITTKKWAWWVLFASTGTLICCALPILLVSLGLGAVVASVFSTLPFLVTLTQYKIWVFSASGLMLLIAGYLLYRQNRSCPADPELAEQCKRVMVWNRRLLWFALALWVIGFVSAYLLLPIWVWLD